MSTFDCRFSKPDRVKRPRFGRSVRPESLINERKVSRSRFGRLNGGSAGDRGVMRRWAARAQIWTLLMAMNRVNLGMLGVQEHIRSAQKRLFSEVIELV